MFQNDGRSEHPSPEAQEAGTKVEWTGMNIRAPVSHPAVGENIAHLVALIQGL